MIVDLLGKIITVFAAAAAAGSLFRS